MQQRIVGIMGAMPEEINAITTILENQQERSIGMRKYLSGTIQGVPTIVVFSRWGKVAAATTVATLIHEFGVTAIIFTGVAGAIHHELNIGDIVLANQLVQHDMDASPLMPKFEIPLLQKTFFEVHEQQLQLATKAIQHFLEVNQLQSAVHEADLKEFKIKQPKLVVGTIASGDQFFSSSPAKEALLKALPSVQCVEMEGAAVAQVCYEYQIPFTIIRIISDAADEHSVIDFPAFINKVASKYSLGIIKQLYNM
jgi:adenosylhomocysteine nucleosidase